MDYITLLILLSILWTAINVLKLGSRKPAPLPPGPCGLPIIGNMLQLGTLPHQALAKLSKTYGPVMSLKLGIMTTIVFSSSDVAEEVFKKHDKNFANRTIFDAARALDHHKRSIAWQPADAHWRFLRKICSTKIFTMKRIEASQGLRQRKVQELLDHVLDCSQTGRAAHIAQAGFTTSLNFISNTIFSMDLAHYDSKMSHEFMGLVRGLFQVIVKPNLADYFPILRFLDPQGIRRQTEFRMENLMAIFNDIVNKRVESDGHGDNDDMLSTLIKLHHENESEFSRKDLNVLLLDMFVAGTDTASTTLEWTMAELLGLPKTLAKAQAELGGVMSKAKMVQESDISKLSYLQAVVKESLRLPPIVPILKHKSAAEVEISGFTIPRDAQIFGEIVLLSASLDISSPNFEFAFMEAYLKWHLGLPRHPTIRQETTSKKLKMG
ncbi:Cytochrome P450 [Dillenia turbinata]|uniref:Cytochrome P450 n=1 Tax=Dillenia turbinata TaxID=194707 RepID=A0AAN8YZ36_9MAGN